MKLSRRRILGEMGVSPCWVLRNVPGASRDEGARSRNIPDENPPLRDTAENPARTAEAPSSPRGLAEVKAQPVSAAVPEDVRAAEIARLDWPELRQGILECRACGLCEKRKQAVPGVGDEKASWLFIGEGPGAEEDARGEPFVGQAGKLLDAMLEAIDLRRGENVYIANAVKCRPPGNRTPEPAEMSACFPYLERQIALISPRLIVLLGRAAVHSVLGLESALSGLRGKRLHYRNGGMEIPVVVTYHPAYLLRNLTDKARAWEDLCHARAWMAESEMP